MNARGEGIQQQMGDTAPVSLAQERSYVYFLRPVGQRGPVKIGSSVRPVGRLANYAIWSPLPLEVAATIAGDRDMEAQFHTLFAADHSHHEWFRGSDRMDAVIDAVRNGCFDLSSLPAPRIKQASLSDVGRENRGLRVRISKRFSGFRTTWAPRVREIYDALSLPPGPGRDLAVEAARRLLAEAAA